MHTRSLFFITKKMGDIQSGLLRFHYKNENVGLSVKVSSNEETLVICIEDDEIPGKKLMNKTVNLIQRYHGDYIYVTGKVFEEFQKTKRILFVQIIKASWFVRQSNGSVSWLQQKHLYENKGKSNLIGA